MARLKTGDKMPDLSFVTSKGERESVYSVLDKDTFFMVLRYIGCRTCRYDVHQLKLRYDEFVKKGVQVYVVMQSTSENVTDNTEEEKLPFEIICDPELVFYKVLDIVPAKDSNELVPPEVSEAVKEKVKKATEIGIVHGKYEGIEEQLPAMFLVAKDGKVKVAHYAKNIMDMPDIDKMLAMI
jgi:peroxiredoxin